jgi:hypothetical protein
MKVKAMSDAEIKVKGIEVLKKALAIVPLCDFFLYYTKSRQTM